LQVAGWLQAFGGLKDGKNLTYLTFAAVGVQLMRSPPQSLALFCNRKREKIGLRRRREIVMGC
jgi:hypothetical protein